MTIQPTDTARPKYPALAAAAVAAALAAPSCMLQQQQQQTGGVLPLEQMPLTIVLVNEDGTTSDYQTTHGELARISQLPKEQQRAELEKGKQKKKP